MAKPLQYRLDSFNQILDYLAEAKSSYYSIIDLRNAFWQVPVSERTSEICTFESSSGLHGIRRLITELASSSNVFQHLLEVIKAGLRPANVLIYIDDLAVFAKTKEEMMEKLQYVFNRLRGAKLRIHPQKSRWFVEKVKYLGHTFSPEGVSADLMKVKIIEQYPRPTTQRKLRAYLGLTNWFRRYIRNYAQKTEALRQLLKKNVKFIWSDTCEQEFQNLKTALTTAPVLILPDFSKSFKIITDASTSGVGFEIAQLDDKGLEHPVAFGGRSLTSSEKHYSITELELLALIHCLHAYRSFFVNNTFTVVTDHFNLKHLKEMMLGQNARLTRWALFLQGFQFTVVYRKGRLNHVADALSRIYERDDDKPAPNDDDLANGNENTNIWNKNNLPQQQSVSTQTDCIDRLTAVIINDIRPVDQSPGERIEQRETDKHLADSDVPQCITIDFDHANASFAVNAIVTDEQTQRLPTLQEIQQELPTSTDFADLYFYLSNGTLPDDDKKARTILLQAPDYTLENGILWNLYTPRTRKLDRAYSVVRRICLPEKFREQMAHILHDKNCHVGADRVYAAARLKYFYPGQYTHLRKHVLSCEVCQKSKEVNHSQKAPIGELGLQVLGQKWFCDIHGPFTKTTSGYSYVCVFVEHVSLWTEFYPLAQVTAEAIVQAFLDCVISRFEAVTQLCLVSDRGSAFTSQLVNLFCKIFHVTQVLTSPYKHNQNQPAEVIGATINKSLQILCTDHKEWDKALPMIALSYRSTPTAGINLSPFQIWFARQMFVETDFTLLSDENITDISPSHLDEVRLRLKVLQNLAIQNATQNAERHRLKYNETAKIPTYKVGDKVLLQNSNVKPHQCAKLQPKFKGPFSIEATLENYQYRLKDLSNAKIMKNPVHADRLRKFNELESNDQQTGTLQEVCIFTGKTSQRQIDVTVKIDDVTTVSCDAIVHILVSDVDDIRGASRAIKKAAG
jgi:hypothetical protein